MIMITFSNNFKYLFYFLADYKWTVYFRLDFRPDPRYEPLVDEDRVMRVEKNPNDLRHSLSKRKHDDDDGFDARFVETTFILQRT